MNIEEESNRQIWTQLIRPTQLARMNKVAASHGVKIEVIAQEGESFILLPEGTQTEGRKGYPAILINGPLDMEGFWKAYGETT